VTGSGIVAAAVIAIVVLLVVRGRRPRVMEE
jgi:hypothetical protein